MKADGTAQIGFIAQEVKLLIPEVVDGADGHMGISYGNLSAVLVKAIKELNAKVDALGTSTVSAQALGAGSSLLSSITEWAGQKITAVTGYFTHLTVGDTTTPTGVTVYDKQGKAGCLEIDDVTTGAMKVTAGVCNVPANNSTTTPTSGGNTIVSGGDVGTSTATTTVATDPTTVTTTAVVNDTPASTNTPTDTTTDTTATTIVPPVENDTPAMTLPTADVSSTVDNVPTTETAPTPATATDTSGNPDVAP
jgi:hypothetical protein